LKIVFLLSHIPDPRINKRISVAKKICDVEVVCVRRASQDIWEPHHKDVLHDIIDIDLPVAKSIFKRFVASLKYIKIAFRLLKKKSPAIIFTEGLDSLGIAVKYKRKYSSCIIIYEVADLRESFIEPPKQIFSLVIGTIIKKQEKCLFRYVNNLIVTSEKFYKTHYYKLIHKDKTIYMPNVPDSEPFRKYCKKTKGVFTVGFIGGIRYLKQMKMLVDASAETGCNVIFAGAGGTRQEYNEILSYCEGKDHVKFFGKYDYTRDISRLYSSIDCVYAVYDANNPNVRIALPNKLYESILCKLPIIVAKNTYLAELIEEWGVGIAVDHNAKSELQRILDQLKNDEKFYSRLVNNCESKKYIIDPEKFNKTLLNILKGYIQEENI